MHQHPEKMQTTHIPGIHTVCTYVDIGHICTYVDIGHTYMYIEQRWKRKQQKEHTHKKKRQTKEE